MHVCILLLVWNLKHKTIFIEIQKKVYNHCTVFGLINKLLKEIFALLAISKINTPETRQVKVKSVLVNSPKAQ